MSADKKQDGFDLSDLTASLPAAPAPAPPAAALSADAGVTVVDASKEKLKEPDLLENLPPKVRKRVEALQELQSQHDEFKAKFLEERAVLEAKYQKFYEPLYTKRCELVNGVVEAEGVTNETADENPAEDKGSDEKGVPDFWLTALKTNEVTAEEVQERDEGALKFLKDIKWHRIENPKGFKLEFYFDPNPYFKNSILSKTYHMIDEDDPILEKAIGTEIEWYPGKCLTQKLMVKKPKKGSKNTKPITKTEQCASFFNFFSPPEVPDDEIADIVADELQNQMEQDYDVGTTIRDKIIPHAVSWFTGEAVEEDDLGDFEDDGDLEDIDEEDEDEDEDDDEEDEDEEDEEDTKPKKAMTKKKNGDVQQAERPPECKQQ